MEQIETITASLRTDTGRVRANNQDFVASWEPATEVERSETGWLYIVADGVGGASAGEVASQVATEQTITHFLHSEESDPSVRLRNAIQRANDDVRQVAATRNSGLMATTICIAYIRQDNVILANVGDSRGYLIHDGTIRQVTNDHSLVAELVAQGALTPEEAAVHPRRNLILSSLGSRTDPQIDLFDISVEESDVIVLCSDGLTRHVSDDEIAEYAQTYHPEEASRRLIDLANERGGSDNISVALLHIGATTITTAGNRKPRIISALSDDIVLHRPEKSRGLWLYTAFLSVIESVLIVMIYYLLQL